MAIDRSVEALTDLAENPACEVICADLEKNKVIFETMENLPDALLMQS